MATADLGDCLVDNPIQYWLLRRRQYPCLSRMAINLFSIPAISSEPERIFSLAGQIVAAQRGRLQADIIGAAQYISSWEKVGLSKYPNRSKSIQIKLNQIGGWVWFDLFVCKPGFPATESFLTRRTLLLKQTGRHRNNTEGRNPLFCVANKTYTAGFGEQALF